MVTLFWDLEARNCSCSLTKCWYSHSPLFCNVITFHIYVSHIDAYLCNYIFKVLALWQIKEGAYFCSSATSFLKPPSPTCSQISLLTYSTLYPYCDLSHAPWDYKISYLRTEPCFIHCFTHVTSPFYISDCSRREWMTNTSYHIVSHCQTVLWR